VTSGGGVPVPGGGGVTEGGVPPTPVVGGLTIGGGPPPDGGGGVPGGWLPAGGPPAPGVLTLPGGGQLTGQFPHSPARALEAARKMTPVARAPHAKRRRSRDECSMSRHSFVRAVSPTTVPYCAVGRHSPIASAGRRMAHSVSPVKPCPNAGQFNAVLAGRTDGALIPAGNMGKRCGFCAGGETLPPSPPVERVRVMPPGFRHSSRNPGFSDLTSLPPRGRGTDPPHPARSRPSEIPSEGRRYESHSGE
jgi:hypothetical protein